LEKDRTIVELAKLLLDRGANPNLTDGSYHSALSRASARGHEQVVKLLLDRGAHINAGGRYRWNALCEASGAGHDRVVKLLLDRGADVNMGGGSYRSALEASAAGHKRVVKLLFDSCFDVNDRGRSYRTLETSVGRHRKVYELLLDYGAEPGQQTEGLVRSLQGADVNLQGEE